jgi:oxaloacetate decarboxylase gamma subunit
MQENLIGQGLELMVFGMGTVVLFLCLLVVATGWMSWLIARFFPEPEAPELTRPAAVAPMPGDPRLVAIIGAAIHRHRLTTRPIPDADGRNR